MRRIISMLMENEPGALSRVVGLFSQRGYNIETLNVAPTDEPTLSRLTLTTVGTDLRIEQITKQLNKLIDVVRLLDLSDGPHIEREMMMIKVKAERASREEVMRLAEIFGGKIVDVTETTFVVELTGKSTKLDGFINAVQEDLVIEVVRTGPSGISRGTRGLSA